MVLALHPDLAELSFLIGTWRGVGEGEWPPGDLFSYAEEVTFEHAGDPFLIYGQRSWSPGDGGPIHFERGFLRPAGPGRAELVLAHPLGIVEVAEGTVQGGVVEVATTSVALTATAPDVTGLSRRIEAGDGELRYELHMATRDVASFSHIRSRLARV